MLQTSLKSMFLFNQEDWKINDNTSCSVTIEEKKHGRGNSPIVQVFIKKNEQDDYTLYYLSELNVSPNGDITFSVPAPPFPFTKIVVM